MYELHRSSVKEEAAMSNQIKENMEVIGADGVHVGTVDRMEGDRIKLKKSDSFGKHEGHHHYIEKGFVAGVEGNKVRLSANADIAVTLKRNLRAGPSGFNLVPRQPMAALLTVISARCAAGKVPLASFLLQLKESRFDAGIRSLYQRKKASHRSLRP
jgi:hypothetical protein